MSAMTAEERAAARERCAKATVEWDCIKYADWQETVLHEQQQWAAKYAAKVLADLPLALDALDAAEQQLTDLRAEVERLNQRIEMLNDICAAADVYTIAALGANHTGDLDNMVRALARLWNVDHPGEADGAALQPSGEGES